MERTPTNGVSQPTELPTSAITSCAPVCSSKCGEHSLCHYRELWYLPDLRPVVRLPDALQDADSRPKDRRVECGVVQGELGIDDHQIGSYALRNSVSLSSSAFTPAWVMVLTAILVRTPSRPRILGLRF